MFDRVNGLRGLAQLFREGWATEAGGLVRSADDRVRFSEIRDIVLLNDGRRDLDLCSLALSLVCAVAMR